MTVNEAGTAGVSEVGCNATEQSVDHISKGWPSGFRHLAQSPCDAVRAALAGNNVNRVYTRTALAFSRNAAY